MGNKVVTLKRDKSLFFFAKHCAIFHNFKIAFYEVSGLIQYLSVNHFRVVLLIVSQVLYLVGIIQLTQPKGAGVFVWFFCLFVVIVVGFVCFFKSYNVCLAESACTFRACVALWLLQSKNMTLD